MNQCIKKKILFFYQLLVFLLLLWLITHPNQIYHSSLNSLKIWLNTLIPSMLLIMILIRFLYTLGFFYQISKFVHPFSWYLFRIDGYSFSYVLISLFLGFPMSSMIIDEAYFQQHINHESAKRLILCVSCASFSFIMVTCPIIYHTETIGYHLFFVQLLSIFILLLLTRKTPIQANSSYLKFKHLNQALTDSIKLSGYAIFLIGSYVLIITSLTPVIQMLFSKEQSIFPRIIMEFSSGSILLASLPLIHPLRYCLQCALLSFGGFCVHMQVMAMVPHISFSYYEYLFYRIIQSIIAFIISSILFFL